MASTFPRPVQPGPRPAGVQRSGRLHEAERDALREQLAMQSTDGLSIVLGWLVYKVGEHTCGGYGPESNYMHEPGCGYEPIIDLSKMEGWPGAERDALAAKVERVRALCAKVSPSGGSVHVSTIAIRRALDGPLSVTPCTTP